MTSVLSDVFDEEVDDRVIESREWSKVQSSVLKEGYREGLTQGQEVSLQEGFNCGFVRGFSALRSISQLRGNICAMLSLGHICKTEKDKEMEQKLQDLLLEVRQLEEKYLKIESGLLVDVDLSIANDESNRTTGNNNKVVRKPVNSTEECGREQDLELSDDTVRKDSPASAAASQNFSSGCVKLSGFLSQTVCLTINGEFENLQSKFNYICKNDT